MAAEQMSLNMDAVGAASNQIGTYITDIDTRTKKFLSLLDEKNQQTDGKFPLFVKLRERLAEDKKNIERLITQQEEIKEALTRYAALAEEASDASAFDRI